MRLCAARPEIAGLSDDRVIVRRVDGAAWVYGTPWAGEARVASASSWRRCRRTSCTFVTRARPSSCWSRSVERLSYPAAGRRSVRGTIRIHWLAFQLPAARPHGGQGRT
jgi:hypothetical protein